MSKKNPSPDSKLKINIDTQTIMNIHNTCKRNLTSLSCSSDHHIQGGLFRRLYKNIYNSPGKGEFFYT